MDTQSAMAAVPPPSWFQQMNTTSFDLRGAAPRGSFAPGEHQYTGHEMREDDPVRSRMQAAFEQKRAAERRASHSQMWPPATSWPAAEQHQQSVNQGREIKSTAAVASPLPPTTTPVPSYESSRSLWPQANRQHDTNRADMWPRRASSSSWFGEYLLSEHADHDDVLMPQQHHGRHGSLNGSIIQVTPWLAAVPSDASIRQTASVVLPSDGLPFSSLSSDPPEALQTTARSSQNSTIRNTQGQAQLTIYQNQRGRTPSDAMSPSYHEGPLYRAPILGLTEDQSATVDSLNSTELPHRQALYQKDSNALFLSAWQYQPHGEQQQQQQQHRVYSPAEKDDATRQGYRATAAEAPAKTFKPMQMVFREGRRSSSSSAGTSSSGSSGSSGAGRVPTAITAAASFCDLLLPPTPHLSLDELAFRRRQGISINYRGDIHNPRNRGDHVPAHANTSLFLMGLPPAASVGDLLRAVAALGPTGRVFAASVNPPDPARRLPLAAAKVAFFTRAQAERLKALVDGGALVMHDGGRRGAAFVVRCAWNRDKKPPRECVQAAECRVLRIRGPAAVVNRAALAAYFDEKFRYELQDVRAISSSTSAAAGGEQTMEWRFASFQSQAIAAKMALNQERKMVRVEYGRDPCEYGEC